MHDVNAQGVDERVINVHYYYCASKRSVWLYSCLNTQVEMV